MRCIENSILVLQCSWLTRKTAEKFTKDYNTAIISDEQHVHKNSCYKTKELRNSKN